MIAVIDYGVGNLFSLCSSLKYVGADTVVTGDPEVIKKADKIILPGVGAFQDARKKLSVNGLDELVIEKAKSGSPVLGICLGMQMLFEESHEYGVHKGLGLIKGKVVAMKGRIPEGLDIPHMGWNALKFHNSSPIFKYINEGDCVYFVHSYFADGCDQSLIASAEYGIRITAAVQSGNVYGCQFHPEKSGNVGLKILKAFCEEDGIQ
ncbi:MAG: imidazole glycerol phosphate synthase subunit HisH [Clostridia bacterium]|nr:imidazole glycerol phosphate synthase subunit HisH [Clostridia bacterium]